MFDEYDDCFTDSSAADEIIEKAKAEILVLLTDKVKAEIKKAAEAKQELSNLQTKIRSAQFDLYCVQNNIKEEYEVYENATNHEIPKKYVDRFVRDVTGDYVPGDNVWVVEYNPEEQKCKTCSGAKKVMAQIHSDGNPVEVCCPECSGRGYKIIYHYQPKQTRIDSISLKLSFDSCGRKCWNRENIYLQGNQYAVSLKNIYPTEDAALEAIAEMEGKNA